MPYVITLDIMPYMWFVKFIQIIKLCHFIYNGV